jgi:hypothetical protein
MNRVPNLNPTHDQIWLPASLPAAGEPPYIDCFLATGKAPLTRVVSPSLPPCIHPCRWSRCWPNLPSSTELPVAGHPTSRVPEF